VHPSQNPARHDRSRRFDTVDVLRGVSILMVILLHSWIRLHSVWKTLGPHLSPWLEHLVFRNGDNGVTIFFAVSGFLITYTSLRRFGSLGAMRPLRFYRIRFARIAPLLLLLLAVLSMLDLLHVEGFIIDTKRESLPGALFSALTFHLNWYEAQHSYLPANWDILWSLSVEEMFYLFFPLLCVGLLRWRRGWSAGWWAFVALLLTFVAMGPFARAFWTKNPIWQDDTYLGGMDAIAMGCLTALLVARCERWRASRAGLVALQALGALLIFWVLLSPTWPWIRPLMRWIGRNGIDGSILPLGACLVIFGSVLSARPGRTWTAPLRWFGRHSYEVYLTHEFVVVWMSEAFLRTKAGPLWWWVAGIVLLTAPLGWAVARFYSEPMNRRLRGGPAYNQHSDAEAEYTVPAIRS
jgi:peptidoglycan/LPS O-acetylase OafA/YrhL